jgi:hypothetical protein
MHAPTTDDKLRKIFRGIGLTLTIACGAFTTMFGAGINKNLLIGAIVIAALIAADLGNAYVWPYVLRLVNQRRWGEAGFAGAVAGISTVVCIMTAFGSVSHVFTESVAEASTQNVKLDDVGVTIAKEEDNEKIYLNRMKMFSEKNGGWITSVSADGLRARLPGLELAIQQEAAKGGCKAKCLAATKERDDVNAKIGTLEALSRDEALLKATREALANLRVKRANTERGESVAQSQNASLAGFVTMKLDPSETAQKWTGRGVAWMITLFLVFGALGFNSLGYAKDDGQKEDELEAPKRQPTTAPASTPPRFEAYASFPPAVFGKAA